MRFWNELMQQCWQPWCKLGPWAWNSMCSPTQFSCCTRHICKVTRCWKLGLLKPLSLSYGVLTNLHAPFRHAMNHRMFATHKSDVLQLFLPSPLQPFSACFHSEISKLQLVTMDKLWQTQSVLAHSATADFFLQKSTKRHGVWWCLGDLNSRSCDMLSPQHPYM